MFDLLPGVLAYDEQDFYDRLMHPELLARAKMFHIDILDGSLFNAKSWADPSIVGSWTGIRELELHCMVQNPLPVIEAWKTQVPNVRRVIVHAEIGRNLQKTIMTYKNTGLEVVVAVNPDTPVDGISGLPIDGLMIMGVQPGKSGQPFLGQPILAKLRRARSLFPNLRLALDGGVSLDTIADIQKAGAERGVASSALWKGVSPGEDYDNLLRKTQ